MQAGSVATSTAVTITASYGGSTAQATVTVVPSSNSGVGISSFTISPSSIVGGFSPLGIVYLTGTAPANTYVSLSSNNQHFVQVPQQVQVTPGYNNVAFPITTSFTSGTVGATIIASLNGTQIGAALTVLPVAISQGHLLPLRRHRGYSSVVYGLSQRSSAGWSSPFLDQRQSVGAWRAVKHISTYGCH